jgi:hypothetical protein
MITPRFFTLVKYGMDGVIDLGKEEVHADKLPYIEFFAA